MEKIKEDVVTKKAKVENTEDQKNKSSEKWP